MSRKRWHPSGYVWVLTYLSQDRPDATYIFETEDLAKRMAGEIVFDAVEELMQWKLDELQERDLVRIKDLVEAGDIQKAVKAWATYKTEWEDEDPEVIEWKRQPILTFVPA